MIAIGATVGAAALWMSFHYVKFALSRNAGRLVHTTLLARKHAKAFDRFALECSAAVDQAHCALECALKAHFGLVERIINDIKSIEAASSSSSSSSSSSASTSAGLSSVGGGKREREFLWNQLKLVGLHRLVVHIHALCWLAIMRVAEIATSDSDPAAASEGSVFSAGSVDSPNALLPDPVVAFLEHSTKTLVFSAMERFSLKDKIDREAIVALLGESLSSVGPTCAFVCPTVCPPDTPPPSPLLGHPDLQNIASALISHAIAQFADNFRIPTVLPSLVATACKYAPVDIADAAPLRLWMAIVFSSERSHQQQ